ncbi:MAG: LysM peptidoglycan-binding domain-containing protein [Eubacterium sp.]|nr:LysM peptidoglycan-binding domain-containing protein [Eubacterium sp.]
MNKMTASGNYEETTYMNSMEHARLDRERKRRMRKREARRKRDLLVRRLRIGVLAAGLLLLIGVLPFSRSMLAGTDVVSANAPLSQVKYETVKIKSGDSLWSIAKEHMNPGYDNIYEYIDDIKECNHMTDDRLNSGCYLLIPYYEYLTE